MKDAVFSNNQSIEQYDPELWSSIKKESIRQEEHIELIASENYASTRVLEAQGSVLTNKYAEGYPSKRYYGGCEYVDIAEELAISRAKELFKADYANVQPHSGSSANAAAFLALLEPNDTILGMSLDHGGHLTHGAKVNFSGKNYKGIQYGLHPETNEIDYDQVRKLAHEHKPKLIIAGFSAYSGIIDWEIFREIADEVGAYFQYNASLKPKKSTFSANYRRVKAKDALSDFLKRYGLTYALVMDNSIVLKPWKPIENHLRVAGRINHALSGERVVGATIYSEKEGVVTHSNAQGVFYLRTKQKQIDFVVSYPGFQPFRDTIIGSGKSFFVEVNLRPQIDRFEVTEIKVKRKNDLPQTENGWSDRVRINGKQLDHFTHLFGEPDVLRALSNTPGVVSGSEGVFGMYVRGGAADQNLILLDDVPVYNPYHMYGLFGIFNGDIVKNAEFYRGNFPTQHGGRLSSVIKVDTKEGNPEKLHGNVNLGLDCKCMAGLYPKPKETLNDFLEGKSLVARSTIPPVKSRKRYRIRKNWHRIHFYPMIHSI